ncbi:MAG: SBBP repeat-containing protein [Anaerolineae bacterium]|nr:SBBP repeat-containing protein [Anaerolineae bacterium]
MNLKRALLAWIMGLTLALLGILGPTLIVQAADPDPGLTNLPPQPFIGPGNVHHPAGQAQMMPEPALVQTTLARLPLRFIPNQGQTDPAVKFHVHSLGGSLFFNQKEVVFSLPAPVEEQGREENIAGSLLNPKSKIENRKSLVRLTFDGANPTPAIEGLNPLPGGANFFLGNDPARWQSNLPTYAGIVYHDLYPGIDLVYRGTDGQLKSEFIVAPGADPRQIRLRYAGAESLSVREDGALVIQTAAGELVEAPLLIYQEVNGVRREIEGRYLLLDEADSPIQNPKSKIVNPAVAFQIAAYNPALPLIIDPELAYSSYLGGNGRDQSYDIAVDNAGNMYVTGYAGSSNFPAKQSMQNFLGYTDAFITQIISTSGVYTYGFSTFLGGSADDRGYRVAVEKSGKIYVTGDTDSSDFPTWKAIQTDQPGRDIFVTQLISVNGVYTLGFSTYVGGNGSIEGAFGLGVDDPGNIYLTGQTSSTDFPTWKAIQDTYGGGSKDSFVTQIISASGVYTFGYSTYLGGNDSDEGYDLVVDDNGNAYITGPTLSSNFPAHNALLGDQFSTDAYATQIIKANNAYTYGFSTYLGGNAVDIGWGIALDSSNNIYVAGSTMSSNFPTWKAIQNDQPSSDVFVTQIISAGGVYTYGYSTYLGGDGGENAYGGVTVDNAGKVYVSGGTMSTDFPIRNAIQAGYGGGPEDAFVTQIISAAGVYTYGYSTYLGGSDLDFIIAAAVDSTGNVYVTGDTMSSDFPTRNAIQETHGGGSVDAFVSKISPSNSAIAVTKSASLNPAQVGQTITYTYRVTNRGSVTLTNISAHDDKLGQVPLSKAILAPGQSATGTLTYTVIAANLPGPLANTVIVTGTPPEGPVVTAAATASVALLLPDHGPDESVYLPLIVKND